MLTMTRRLFFRIFTSLVVALIIIFASIGWRIVTFDASNHEGTFDCAIILGAAVDSGSPLPVFKARLDHGIDLYRQGSVKALLFTGGVGQGDSTSEGDAGAIYAQKHSVSASDLLVERKSKTTLQNLEGAKIVMDDHGLRTALIVSDPLHLRRSIIIAKWLAMDVAPSATPYSRYETWKTKLPFLLREIYFTIHFRLFRQ